MVWHTKEGVVCAFWGKPQVLHDPVWKVDRRMNNPFIKPADMNCFLDRAEVHICTLSFQYNHCAIYQNEK